MNKAIQQIRIVTSILLILIVAIFVSCGRKESQSASTEKQQEEIAVTEEMKSEQTPQPGESAKPELRVEDEILIYLGYKSGTTRIIKLCGLDLKGEGGLPPGVFLSAGTGFTAAFGMSQEVKVVGKPEEGAYVACQNGATVEYEDGTILIMKDGVWVDKSTGKEHSLGYMEPIPFK